MSIRIGTAVVKQGAGSVPAAIALLLLALVSFPPMLRAQADADAAAQGPRILTADLTRRQAISTDTIRVSLIFVDTEPIVEVKVNGVVQQLPKQDELELTTDIDNRKPETVVTVSAKDQSGRVTENSYLILNPVAAAAAAKAVPPVVVQADKWDGSQSLKSARAGAAAVTVGDQAFVFGGYSKITYAYDSALTATGDTSEYVGTSEQIKPDGRSYISGAPVFASLVAAAAVQGKVYVFESRRVLHEYDPAKSEWRTLYSPLLLNRIGPAVAFGDDVYVFGGVYGVPVAPAPAAGAAATAAMGTDAAKPRVDVRPSPLYWRYTPGTNTWKVMGYMPAPRMGAAACRVGRIIYLVGGFDGTKALDQVEAFDVSLGTWSIVLGMPGGRAFPTCVSVNNRLLVFGGAAGGPADPPLDWSTLYDPTTKQWSVRAKMPTARGDATAALLGDTTYVFGGLTTEPTDKVETYK
jgi:N-acetylneuraminic acid mutarotase